MEKRYKVKMNSIEKVEELLQEIYEQSCRQLIQIENEITKLCSINLAESDIDSMAKYSKSVHDLLGDKTKAIQQKFEIAKFMGEMVKHGGDINATLDDAAFVKKTKLNISDIRSKLMDNNIQNYDLK